MSGGEIYVSRGEQNIKDEVQKLNEIMDRFDKGSTKLSKAMLRLTWYILGLTLLNVVLAAIMVYKMFVS
jgi:ABC-type uncharacterized transport system fused permease/ATPase subunit